MGDGGFRSVSAKIFASGQRRASRGEMQGVFYLIVVVLFASFFFKNKNDFLINA